ncbi:hypothetical protein NDN01_10965 [Sphingomonas sp. QA11]|uniref:hypothetical protein n=1 Tax=Sphingomonas sp. QA11 TaxID=2950605 RepID=UPI00234B8E40|nr:hypothetical protein [Sphingomonas sp. QA11]WCM29363.1 hypothetical protein NDN01_10965 [Sphingomonas sp. QA11]
MSAPLLLGMLAMPVIFVWFFLRRGYSRALRRAAFTYTATLLTIGLIGILGR